MYAFKIYKYPKCEKFTNRGADRQWTPKSNMTFGSNGVKESRIYK